MNASHKFRPHSLDLLESRLALSGSMATLHPTMAHIRTIGVQPKANAPADRDTRTFEISFLTGMIPHHQMAIDMSRLALKYGNDMQVRSLAKRIISEQKPEILKMNRFIAVDGVQSYRPGKAQNEMQDLKDLGSNRGTSFDRAFLTMMMDHHMMAIEGNDMGMVGAKQAQTRASQPGIRSLASNIVATQTREISEMQGILARLHSSPTPTM